MTDWSPDTCGCTIRVKEDWSEGEFLKRCEHHQKVAHSDSLLVVHRQENQIKNHFLGHIAENFPHVLKDAQEPVEQGLANSWAHAYRVPGEITFDADRNLVFKSTGFSPTEIKALQAHCDGKWGAGKVLIK